MGATAERRLPCRDCWILRPLLSFSAPASGRSGAGSIRAASHTFGSTVVSGSDRRRSRRSSEATPRRAFRPCRQMTGLDKRDRLGVTMQTRVNFDTRPGGPAWTTSARRAGSEPQKPKPTPRPPARSMTPPRPSSLSSSPRRRRLAASGRSRSSGRGAAATLPRGTSTTRAARCGRPSRSSKASASSPTNCAGTGSLT